MTATRRFLTRGRAIAWVLALALGIGFAVLLRVPSGDFEPVAALFLILIGWFGSGLGLLMMTGVLVTVMRLLGNPTRAVSSAPEELPADRVAGVFVLLFSLPALVISFHW